MTCRNHAVCPPCHARPFSITALAVIRTPCQVFALGLLTHASLAIKQLDDDAFQRRKFPSKKNWLHERPNTRYSMQLTTHHSHHDTPYWIDCTHLGSARRIAPAQP